MTGPLLGAVAALGCAAAIVTPAGSTARRAATADRGLASLPAAAQGAVSAALGRDQPAYRVTRLDAVNPAQRLRIGFSRRGVTVAAGAARLSLTLSSYGYASAPTPVSAVTPRASANRVSYADGALTQWFTNGPLGLEQGFDLAARPNAGRGPLTFSLALSGGLAARLEDGSVLLEGRGVSLRYGGLVATDARGRVLRSWLALPRGRLLIHIDDRGAVYPLRIDPFVQEAELTASRGEADDRLGVSVAVAGDTIVVGAPDRKVGENKEQGVAYVFTVPASGWANAKQIAELTANGGEEKELFGRSVAIAGNTIVVGAPFRKVGANAMQGEAYVFVKPTSGWAGPLHQIARLTAEGGEAGEDLGESVAVSGETAIVGAPSRSEKHGAAYVFVMAPGGWANATQTAELTAKGGEKEDELGYSVAVSGDTIVAGAFGHMVGSNEKQGAAYVFLPAAGGWEPDMTQTAELTVSGGEAKEGFGESVAVAGATVVVGAPSRSEKQGAAYVFAMPASGWAGSLTQTAELTAKGGEKEDELGQSVAISGDTVVAGAPHRKVGANEQQGAAYVFVMGPGGWANATQTAEPSAGNGGAKDHLGEAVAVSGDTVLAGAPAHEVGEHEEQGAAYVFEEPPSVTISSPVNGAIYRQGQVVAAGYLCGTPSGTSVVCSGPVASGAAIETSTVGSHSFVVNATDSDALFASQSATYTVLSAPVATHLPTGVRTGGGVPSALAGPILGSLSETARRWREGNLLAHISASLSSKTTNQPPLGTTFSFTLNKLASVTFTFTEQATGRKVGKSCVAQTNENKHMHRCARTVVAGALNFSAHPGSNKVRFEGSISSHKKLRPGSYTLLVTATALGRHSTTGTLHFTIVHG